jgi:hypothetical protein
MSLYYTPPPKEVFDDMKQVAMQIWETYADPYRTEKIDRTKDIQNISDNFMYMFAMFDMSNQHKVVRLLKPETQKELRDRVIDGGNDESYLLRIGL